MFGVSGAELLVILLVGLIVLGPDRLPVVARKAGQVLGDLRRMSSGFEAEVRTALFEAEHPERYRPGGAADSVVDPPAPAAAGTDADPEVPADAGAVDSPTEPAEPADPAS